MIAPEDYKLIADMSYTVDPLEPREQLRAGEVFSRDDGASEQEFFVYDTATDPVSGFQGMAAVPIVDGEPDFSHVYVAFAGTNPADRADLVADLVTATSKRTGPGTQTHVADKFMDHLETRLKQDGHAGARMETVGHSLGGFLAMWVAGERHLPSTTFNGPDPWEALSPQAKDWIREQRELGNRPMTNWVNQFDLIGNSFGHKTGAGVLVKDAPGKGLLDYHNLATGFVFDGGVLRNSGGRLPTVEEIAAALDVVDPGHAQALRIVDGLTSTVKSMKASTLGTVLSGLIVTVDTVGAGALAASIGGLTTHLHTIKEVNGNLIPSMTAALANAKRAAAQLYPWITESDIEDSIWKHDLHVELRIDEGAVAAVDRLVDDHVATVVKISDGVNNVVRNAVEQDKQWARAYELGPIGER